MEIESTNANFIRTSRRTFTKNCSMLRILDLESQRTQCMTNLVNGKTYASMKTRIPTRQASAMLWKKT